MVDLADARDDRRLRERQRQLDLVLLANRSAVARLCQTGAIFTRSGARLGRELLLAHQDLLEASELLDRLEHLGAAGPRDPDIDTLYDDVDALLARASELSARSEGLLARNR